MLKTRDSRLLYQFSKLQCSITKNHFPSSREAHVTSNMLVGVGELINKDQRKTVLVISVWFGVPQFYYLKGPNHCLLSTINASILHRKESKFLPYPHLFLYHLQKFLCSQFIVGVKLLNRSTLEGKKIKMSMPSYSRIGPPQDKA